MIKGIILIAVVLGLTYFGLDFSGYKAAPENLHYYAPGQMEKTTEKNGFMQYLDLVKSENKIHPLIIRKKGVSGAASLDQSSTKLMKDLLQVDKFEQMEKLKKTINEVAAKADAQNKTIEDASKI